MASPDDLEQARQEGGILQQLKDIAADVKDIKGQNAGFFAALAGLQGDMKAHDVRIGTLEIWKAEVTSGRLERRGIVLQTWQAFGSIGIGLLGIALAIYEAVSRVTGKG